MAGSMGRRRTVNLGLPEHMHCKARGGKPRYYYGRRGLALGADLGKALIAYAKLHVPGSHPAGTFAQAVTDYEREELPKKSVKTQGEYGRQLATLVGYFPCRLDQITPAMVAGFLRERSKKVEKEGKTYGGAIAATREKALLSAVLTFARATGLYDGANPCAGIRGTKSKRDRYVSDDELADSIVRAQAADDQVLAGFLELCYLTGQRPSDVVKIGRSDAQNGVLHVRQGKTATKVRIELVGPLAALYERLRDAPAPAGGKVASMYLVRDESGQAMTLGALRNRFVKLGCTWQIRDLRAKAASDADTARDAQTLLGHAAATTTDNYIRQRAGARATPIMRKVTK